MKTSKQLIAEGKQIEQEISRLEIELTCPTINPTISTVMNKIYIGIITGDGLGSESLSDCKTFSNLTDCQDWLKGEFAGFSEDEGFESYSVDFDKSNRALHYSWSDEEEGDFLQGWIVQEKINS